MTRRTKKDSGLRQSIIDACLRMNARGINQGTSGNISVRTPDGMLITPSGIPYETMTPDMLVELPLDRPPAPDAKPKPSSEWRFHRSLLRARPDINAVVHAHPPHCTALAIQRQPIPACHYTVAIFGGDDVRLAGYALYGSEELADEVVRAMTGRYGCLMANHGATVVGETLDRAFWRLEELENLSRTYLLSRIGGTPAILGKAEMDEVMVSFSSYGPGAQD